MPDHLGTLAPLTTYYVLQTSGASGQHSAIYERTYVQAGWQDDDMSPGLQGITHGTLHIGLLKFPTTRSLGPMPSRKRCRSGQPLVSSLLHVDRSSHVTASIREKGVGAKKVMVGCTSLQPRGSGGEGPWRGPIWPADPSWPRLRIAPHVVLASYGTPVASL